MKEKDLFIILRILQINSQNRNKLHLSDVRSITGMQEETYLRKIALLEGMGYIRMSGKKLLNITKKGTGFLNQRGLINQVSQKENFLINLLREDTYTIIGVFVALMTLATILVFAF